MSASEQPLVSVLMPVFNGEKYIREAIDSILNQTFADFELVIVNDGSTDQSASIVESYSDPRIRLYHNDRNRGLSYTRNRCIELAKGELLAKLDCDDIALPTRLADQVAFLREYEDFGLIGGWVQFIDSSGILGEVASFLATSEQIPSVMLFHNCFAQSALMFRRSVLPREWYRDEYPPAEDYDLWIRIARKTRVANLPKVVTYYRLHDANVSKVKHNMMLNAERKILHWQLEELGFISTEEEFETVFSIKKGNVGLTETYLVKLRKCLDKLKIANFQRKIYQEPFFGDMLATHWQTTLRTYQQHRFLHDVKYSLHLLADFYLSPLQHYRAYGFKFQCQFLMRCLLQSVEKGKRKLWRVF